MHARVPEFSKVISCRNDLFPEKVEENTQAFSLQINILAWTVLILNDALEKKCTKRLVHDSAELSPSLINVIPLRCHAPRGRIGTTQTVEIYRVPGLEDQHALAQLSSLIKGPKAKGIRNVRYKEYRISERACRSEQEHTRS